MSARDNAIEIKLDEKTEEALEELFDSHRIRDGLIEHYMRLAEIYKEVISESPLEKPDFDTFRGMLFDAFSINVARCMFRMKASVLFNLTVAEEDGRTYGEIQKMITNVMLACEDEFKEMEDVEEYRKYYPKQMEQVERDKKKNSAYRTIRSNRPNRDSRPPR